MVLLQSVQVVVGWLNTNAGAVTAIATVILTGTTIVYAWHTWQLAKENRLLRKAGTDPQVVAYAGLNSRVWGAIDFVIANIGKGAAKNVSFSVISGGEDFATKKIRLPHKGVTYAFLPQDEQIADFLGMGWDLLAPPPLAPFKVEVRYSDLKGTNYRERFEISILGFGGLVRLGSLPDEEIAKHIKEIADTLSGWKTRGLRVETITVQEKESRDEKRRNQIIAQREKQ